MENKKVVNLVFILFFSFLTLVLFIGILAPFLGISAYASRDEAVVFSIQFNSLFIQS